MAYISPGSKLKEFDFSILSMETNNEDTIWLVVRDGLADITNTVWTDTVGGFASVTLPAPGGVSPNIADIYEYTPANNEAVLIFKNIRIFEHPTSHIFYREDYFSTPNNGVEGFGYNGQEVQSLPGRRPFTEADNPSGWGWTGWVMQVEDGPLVFYQGQLYLAAYSYLLQPGVPTYHHYLGLFRYNDTGTWTNGSWTLAYSWGPFSSVADSSGHIRLTAKAREGTSGQYMILINSYLNSGRGVVTFSLSANRFEDCTSTPDQAIDFWILNNQGRPYQTSQIGHPRYMGRDADGDWLWEFDPYFDQFTNPGWTRSYQIFAGMWAAPQQGNAYWRRNGGASYAWNNGYLGAWIDTFRGIHPLWAVNLWVGAGYLIAGADTQLYIMDRSDGNWTVSEFGVLTPSGGGGENNGPHGIINLRAYSGYLVFMDTSQHVVGPVQSDMVYVASVAGNVTVNSFDVNHPINGLYVGIFDPGGGDELLSHARADFWAGPELAQNVFQVSMTDERVYLGRPYYAPSGAWVGRYTGDYIGNDGTLSEDEDITDNLTTTDGVLGLDLTDGV